jgi:hypothetical protein
MSVIGKMTKSRGTWGAIKPVTKIVPDKKKYSRKEKHRSKGDAGE